MEELKVFSNEELGNVRILEIDGEPWFVGKDVANLLGYTNPQKALRDHIDEEDKTLNDSFTINGRKAIFINEPGLYSLILSSKLPNAKKFKKWVTSEVLPVIRKTWGDKTPPQVRIEEFIQKTLDFLHHNKYNIIVGKKVR